MLRAAIAIILIGTAIGALMPAGSDPSVELREQTAGEKLFVVDGRAAPQIDDGTGAVMLDRNSDGHFYVDAKVNGMPVNFLVDTGATGVALTVKDAERAGVPINPALFGVIGSGASGEVRGEQVRLDQITVGPKTVGNLAGVVIEGGEQSLLGQSFLGKFDTVEIRGDTMVLR